MTEIELEERVFEAEERIIEQGDPAMEAFLIVSGKVRVSVEKDGQSVKLAELGPDEIFGETALFKGSDYGAHVDAAERTVLVPITPDILDRKIKSCDPMLRALIRMMMTRLRQANAAILDNKTQA